MTPVAIVGWTAAAAGILLGLPQLIRLLRTRCTAGLSLIGWQSILVLNIIWAAHGMRIAEANMTVVNLLGLGSTGAVLFLLTRDRGLPLFPVVWPPLAVSVVFVGVDLLWGSTAFGLASLLPAILANVGQIAEVVRSAEVTGVSTVFLALGLVNQLLWLTWAVLLQERSSLISSFMLVVLISFNLVWYVLRRRGLRALFVKAQPVDVPAEVS